MKRWNSVLAFPVVVAGALVDARSIAADDPKAPANAVAPTFPAPVKQ